MSYQQSQQQCQPPPKCQTPKNPPQAPCTQPISSGCGSSSGGCGNSGGCGSLRSLGGLGGLGGLGSGCSLFSHHRRSHTCRGQSPGHCDSGSGYNQQSGDCGGSSGGC